MLNKSQSEFLKVIVECIDEYGYIPPSIVLSKKSNVTIQQVNNYLRQLTEKKYLEKTGRSQYQLVQLHENHLDLLRYIIDFMQTHKYCPSNKELTKLTGRDDQEVNKSLRILKQYDYLQVVPSKGRHIYIRKFV